MNWLSLFPATVLTTALLTAVALMPIVGPAPSGDDGSVDVESGTLEFSVARAGEHLCEVASEPHPVGSYHHARVRAFIVETLKGLGWQVQIQEGEVDSIPLANIVARRGGAASTGTVVLACHYDSVPAGPGAADDGVAVAALLEVARVVGVGPVARNDLILLFTDGEELGLLGAELFMANHPAADEIGVVVNFEARGNSGPSIMFETSPQNGRLIREYADVAPCPIASSLAYAVYKLLPNDTDMSVFKRADIDGLNFAFIGGFDAYHTGFDTPDNLSVRSLQHHGASALALARRFGEVDLRDLRAPDEVFFSVADGLFVHYPESWVGPGLGIALVVATALVVLAIRHGGVSFSSLVCALWAFSRMFVEVPLLVLVLWGGPWLILSLFVEEYGPPIGEVTSAHVSVIGVLVLTSGLLKGRLAIALLGSRCGSTALAIVGLAPTLGLLVVTSLFLGGASYLFFWTFLSSSVGLFCVLALRVPIESGCARFLVAVSALPGVVLFGQTSYLVYLALMKTPYFGALTVSAFSLCLWGAILPFLDLPATGSSSVRRVAVVMVGFGILVVGLVLRVLGL